MAGVMNHRRDNDLVRRDWLRRSRDSMSGGRRVGDHERNIDMVALGRLERLRRWKYLLRYNKPRCF